MRHLFTLFFALFSAPFLLANTCSTATAVSLSANWQGLSDNQFDNEESWYVLTPAQNGTLQICRAAGFSIYDGCTLGNPSGLLYPAATSTTCTVGIGAPVEELQVFAGNSVYMIVQAGFAGSTVNVRLLAGGDSGCEATCYENPELSGGQVVQCDNFEAYAANQFITPQSPSWRKWADNTDDAPVRFYANSTEKYLRIERTSTSAPDVIYELGNRTSGRYRLSWEMNVLAGRSAYYNILHTLPNSSGNNGNLAFQVIFNSDGSGLLDKPGPNITFSYNNGGWNRAMQIIDLDDDLVEFWINDEFIGSWVFSEDISTTPGANRLAGIDFYAYEGLNGDASNLYAVDNICLWEVQGCGCPLIYDPVCVKNGIEYSNNCYARCSGGYIAAEWDAGPCNNNTCQGTAIQCGQTITNQTTVGQSNGFNSLDYANCQSSGELFSGPDRLYELTIIQRQQIKIFLDIQSNADLDLFLLDQCTNPQQPGVVSATNCIAASHENNNSTGVYKEAIDIILDPGTYYIVVDGKSSNNQGQFSLFVSCDCSCSEPANDQPAGNVMLCDDFGGYDLAAVTPQSTRWRLWDTGADDGAVISQGGNQVLKIEENGQVASDVLYLLDNLNTGRYRLSWRMWVDSGKAGYYNIQHSLPDINNPGAGANWAYEVYFNADGTGTLDLQSQNIGFNYINGNWNNVMQIIDIDQDRAELWINHQYIASWNFSEGSAGSNSQFAAINFFAFNNNSYLVDDICLWQVGLDCGIISCLGQEPVCAQNGAQYACPGRARCEGYVSSEWERCFSICDYGGTFVYRSDAFTDTMRITDLAPPLLRQEPCVLSSYNGVIPDNFYADIYIFYNDDSEEVGVNNLPMGDNTKFFVFSCDCTGAICAQTCLGEVGNDFSGGGLPEGFYYIVATNTATEAYGFNVTPNGECDDGNAIPTLSLSNPASSGNVSNNLDPSAFDTGSGDGANAYGDCYNGRRAYTGKDTVYRFTLPEPAIVSLSLESAEPMGLFLYNYLCARNCMLYTETGTQGGLASLDSIPLLDGVYYLIVDKASPGGDGSYTITLDYFSDEFFYFSNFNSFDDFVDDCPPDPGSTHLVTIPETAFPLTSAHRMTFLAFDNGIPRVIEGMSQFWPDYLPPEVQFPIPEDLAGDTYKCSYLPGDEITLYLKDFSSGNSLDILCELEYQPANTGGVTAEGLFTPSATSLISRIKREEVSHAYVSSIYETVPSGGATLDIEVSVNNQQWTITERPETPWLQATPASYFGPRFIEVIVDPNLEPTPRSAFLQFTFEGAIPTYHYVFIKQLGVCITPQVNISANNGGGVVCTGEEITLTAQADPGEIDGLYQFMWNTGDSLSSITISPDDDRRYSVTVTEKNCFDTVTASVDITVEDAPPLPESQGDRNFCEGQAPPVLEVASTEQVFWYNQPQGGMSLGTGLSFAPNAEGTYYAEAVTGNGCASISRTPITATMLPAPNANAGPDTSVCAGQPITLNATASGGGGNTYVFNWSGGLPSIPNPTVSPASDITYSLTVTGANGCTDTDEVSVEAKELPQASLSSTDASCGQPNGSAAATAAGGQGSYSFIWSDGQSGPQATGLSPGPISVTVSDGFGCSTSAAAVVGNIPGPSIFPMNGQEICAGQSATLAAGANGGTEPYIFSWNQGLPDGPSQIVSPPSTTTYQVTVTDANNCTATTGVAVAVNPLPQADAGEDGEICRGGQYILQASGSGGTGGYTYHWDNGLGFGPEKLVSPLASTTYTITITDDKGCSDTDEARVVVNPLPTLAISREDAACGQDNGSALAIPAGGTAPYAFLWSNGQADEEATGLAAGSYSVTATDSKGCAATATVAISDQAGPIVDIPGVSRICRGDSANLTALVLDGNGPYGYAWSNQLGAGMSIRVAPPATATYSVTVTDVNGCIGVAQATIPVAQRATVNAGPNQPVCLGEEIQLNGQIGNGAVSSEWDALISGGNFSPGPEALDAVFTPPAGYTGPITLALMATAEEPCPSVLSYMVVDIKPLPTLEIDGNLIECEPGFETYGFEILSNAGQVACSAGIVAPAGPGVFAVSNIPEGLDVTVTASNAVTGCENIAEVTSPECECTEVVPEPPLSLGNVEVCEGEPFPALQVEVGEGETAAWYQNPTGGGALAENTTTFVPPAAGTYYAALVNPQLICESVARVEVTLSIKPLPVANAGEGQTICPGGEAILQAQEGEGYTYLWSNGATTATTTVSPGTTRNYTVTVTANGCSAEDMVTVTVTPAIEAEIILLNALNCFGDANGSLLVNATGGVPPLSFEWPNGSTLAGIAGLAAGTYAATVTDQAGCETTESFTLTQPPALLETSRSITTDTNGLHTGAISVGIGGGSPPYTFNWTGPGGFASSQQNLSGLAAGNYFLAVRDSRQCALQLGPFAVPVTVGLEDNLQKRAAVRLYPNPTTGRVWAFISLPRRGDAQMEAFNPLGERILQLGWKDITEKAAELDFSAYPSGIYLIKITHGQEVIAERLIVQQY